MHILFLGDMVGRAGRNAVYARLPDLIDNHGIEFVVVNGENAAGGFGVTEAILRETLDAGADVMTTGNHVWDQREALTFADRHDRFLRPANFPDGTPGRGANVFEARNGARVLVANVMGNMFMSQTLKDPFETVDVLLGETQLGRDYDAALIDFHAEATSEKMCIGHHLDGRVSLVVGTHTHVPTADHQILTGGTAYMSDAGMCGDYDSSIGMDKEEPLNRFITKLPRGRFEAADGPASLCGIAVRLSDNTGLAEDVHPVRLGGRLQEVVPPWW